jgi:tetratricopeptide (TPR) repeat protein
MGAPLAQTDESATDDPLLKPFAVNSNQDNGSLTTYLSLIQQHLSVFMVDNAIFLAERCVAQYHNSQEALYLLALCHYRANAPARAQQVLLGRQAATPNAAQQYLLAICAFDLKDYARAEEALLKQARVTYKQQNRPSQDGSIASMDDWILATTVSTLSAKVD